MTDDRINELALLHLHYDRAIRTLDFARAIEREVLATPPASANVAALWERCSGRPLVPGSVADTFARALLAAPPASTSADALTDAQLDAVLAEWFDRKWSGHHTEFKERMRAAIAVGFAAPIASADARDAARWRWLKMQSTVGEQTKIMRTPWGEWDAFADSCIASALPTAQGDKS
jgi:hypothetical protein